MKRVTKVPPVRLEDRTGRPIIAHSKGRNDKGDEIDQNVPLAEPCECTGRVSERDDPASWMLDYFRSEAAAKDPTAEKPKLSKPWEPKKDCENCGGRGTRGRLVTMLDWAEEFTNDPKFIDSGMQGYRAAQALVNGCKSEDETFTLSDSEHTFIKGVIDKRSERVQRFPEAEKLYFPFVAAVYDAKNEQAPK